LWLWSLGNIHSDKRMGLSFTIAAGPRQRNHSQPSNRVARLYRQEFGSLFRRLLRLAGLRWKHSTRLLHGGDNPCLSLILVLRPTVSQAVCLSWNEAFIWGLQPDFYVITIRQLWVSWRRALSQTRERICRLQMLLVLASAVILEFESLGISDHIILSQIRSRLPFSSPPTTRRVTLEVFDPASTRHPCRVDSFATIDGPSVSLSWNKAPIWSLRPDLYCCQTVADLLIRGALSDERMGLSSTIAAGPHLRTQSLVGVPWDWRPYFTVSDSRLPFSSPPTTRRVTLEVFDPASTRATPLWDSLQLFNYLRPGYFGGR
jgi:hypothetical protein